jgi:anti-sigma factor RsiW
MKGKCKYLRDVNAYLDGELSKKRFEKFQTHVKECPICQNELRQLNTLNNFLSRFKTETIPENVYKRILNETNVVKKHIKSIELFHKISKISIAASILFAFLSGIFISNTVFASESKSSSEIEFAEDTLYEYLNLGD